MVSRRSRSEPTTLALIALSGLLILSLKRRSRLLVLVQGMLVVSFFSSPSPAQAQTSPPQPDSVVAIVADAQGLPFVPPSQRPRGGVYWEVRAWFPSQPTPVPCPPHDPNTPVYAIAGDNYLEDRTGGELLAPTAWSFAYRALGTTNPAVVLQAEVAALQDFVAQVQARNLSAQAGLSSRTSAPNALEGLQGGGVAFNGLTDGFNDLRLEIINTNPVTTNLWLRWMAPSVAITTNCFPSPTYWPPTGPWERFCSALPMAIQISRLCP